MLYNRKKNIAVADSLVVIPTYKESENIERMIHTIFSLEAHFDVLVIDDNSPDGTPEIVQNLQQTYPENLHLVRRKGKLGLGTAYITGFKWALERDYAYIMEMDADFSHDPEDLPRLRKACADEGADLCIGSRYISGVNVINWPIGRVIISYFASAYVRFITGMKVQDTTAGFKCYTRRVLETINLDQIRMKGYGFQIEMKFTAHKHGFRIMEIPIIFTERREGASKMSGGIFNEALWGVIRMRIKSIFKRYKQVS